MTGSMVAPRCAENSLDLGKAEFGWDQDRCPAVVRIGAALDQSGLHQRGHLPRHRGRIRAKLLGEITGPSRAVLGEPDQQEQLRMVCVGVGARPGT